jgi:hypothetical protein
MSDIAAIGEAFGLPVSIRVRERMYSIPVAGSLTTIAQASPKALGGSLPVSPIAVGNSATLSSLVLAERPLLLPGSRAHPDKTDPDTAARPMAQSKVDARCLMT